MEYRIITDTVLPPKHSTALFERMIPVFPRTAAMRAACPGKAEFSSVCAYDTPTFVLTAPAQLSGTYASARDALSRVQNAIVIDSKTFGAGQLLLADLTAKTADCESFSIKVSKQVRALRTRIFCLFTAPYGQAHALCGQSRHRPLIPALRHIYTIGEEGDIQLFYRMFARSDEEALFWCLKQKLSMSPQTVAVAYLGKSQEAQALCHRITTAGHSILIGKMIRTDLPLGFSGCLSAAILLSEE